MHILYDLLTYLATPFVLLRLWWRGRTLPAYRQRIRERFGYYQLPALQDCIWLHAVSLGETVAAEPMINRLLAMYPDKQLVVTAMTTTGSERQQRLGERVHHVYFPYDMPHVVKRFLNATKPKLLILMETELWPNVLKQCQKQQIPVLLANARLSEKSLRTYQHLHSLARNMVKRLSVIAAQSNQDAARYRLLGASDEQIQVLGNIKFDMNLPTEQLEQAQVWRSDWPSRRKVLVAASTHDGEETKVLAAFKQIKQRIPEALLILVPRHPDRFSKVTSLCQQQGFETITRSSGSDVFEDVDVVIGDTMGEMYFYYGCADLAFVAGSFAPIGGHNILETAASGTPIIVGPHMHNFYQIRQLFLDDQALIEVQDENELAEVATHLLQHDLQRDELVENANRVLANNRDALNKHLEVIKTLL